MRGSSIKIDWHLLIKHEIYGWIQHPSKIERPNWAMRLQRGDKEAETKDKLQWDIDWYLKATEGEFWESEDGKRETEEPK